MNSRERVRTALEHRCPDRVPLLLWMTPEVSAAMRSHLQVESDNDLLDKLDIDVRWLLADYVGPELKEYEDGSREDMFGMRMRSVKNEFGAYDKHVYHPLAQAETVEQVDQLRWPEPQWWDYTSLKREIALADRVEPRWLGIGYVSFFERGWCLTGFEKWLFDIAMNPELVDAILDRLFDLYLAQTRCLLEAAEGRIDMVYLGDDLSSQDSLLISPAMFRRFIKGRWQRFIDTIKEEFGDHLKFHFHSCGAVAEIVPDLIDMGIDILNPLQPLAKGMEPAGLKSRFGKKLSFSGGFDIQELLPHSTAQEVWAEAQRLVGILGRDGGYIASAAHAVQPDTSVENIMAMLDGFKNAG